MMHALGNSLLLFSVFVVTHGLSIRLFPAGSFLRWAITSWAVLLPSFLVAMPQSNFSMVLFVCFLATSHWGLYLMLLVNARNSVTLRIMDEVDRMGKLALSDLGECFSDAESVIARLESMEKGGFMARDQDGHIYLLPRGRYAGQAALLIRRIFSIPSTR